MSNLYTTKTANLKATKGDFTEINLKGKNILEYINESSGGLTTVLDERGDFVTDRDLWGTEVTTDENGTVHVSHKFLKNPNAYNNAAWDSTVTKVEDNIAYQGENFYCNIQTDMIKDGTYMFRDLTNLTSFESDLSSLQNGTSMFYKTTNLNTFNTNLDSLTNGSHMFYETNLTGFGSSLYNLKKGKSMFCRSKLQSIESDFSSLIDGTYMFYITPLHTIIAESGFPKLENGTYMFSQTDLQQFNFNLLNLKDGSSMFRSSDLLTFNSNLCNLKNGSQMFYYTNLSKFTNNLNLLQSAEQMFLHTPLESFNSGLESLETGTYMFDGCSKLNNFETNNLDSLIRGGNMFSNTAIDEFVYDLPSLIQGMNMFFVNPTGIEFTYKKLIDGELTNVTETVVLSGLKKSRGALPSLQCGYYMFACCKLDEDSIMVIADTINDIREIKANNSWSSVVQHNITGMGGILHIDYDSTICDAKKIDEYCTEIMNKGWTVYLNGTIQTSDEGIEGVATLAEDGTIAITPTPYYCKPHEVPAEYAEWTDGEKYYIILGAQRVFGDDLSNYGMFASIQDAAANMRFTPYTHCAEEDEVKAEEI